MNPKASEEPVSSRLETLRRLLRERIGSDLAMSFATGSAGAFTLRLAGTGLTLLLQMLLTRVMGATRYGDYIYALNWVTLLAVVAILGLDTASLRFIAAYAGTRDWRHLRGFRRRAVQATLLTSTLLATLLVGAVLLLGGRISGELRWTFFAAAALLPVAALLQLFTTSLQGLKHIVAALTPQWVLRPLLLGLGVLLGFYLIGSPPSSAGVMTLDLGAALTAVVALLVLLRIKTPRAVAAEPPAYLTRHWLLTGLPLLAITGVRLAMNRIDVLLIGVFLDTTQAGIYAVAVQLATLISFGLMAVNMIAAPLIAELHAQRRQVELQRLIRLGANTTFVFATATGVALVLGGRFALALFGPAFVAAYAPLGILVAGQIVNSLSGSVGFIMSMTGHERQAARITVLTGLLNLLLNVVLIPRFGLLGAATATTLATVAWNLGLVIEVKKLLNINSTVFGRLPA